MISQYSPRIQEILKSENLERITPKFIRLQLEKEFQVDLSECKSQLKSLIFELLGNIDLSADKADETQIKPESSHKEDKDQISKDEIIAKTLSCQRSRRQPTTKKRKVNKTGKKTGFHKEYYLSKELSEFLGIVSQSRPQVVKDIWKYIKENELQDSKDKRFINCDEKFKALAVDGPA